MPKTTHYPIPIRRVLMGGFLACLFLTLTFYLEALYRTAWNEYARDIEQKQTLIARNVGARVHGYITQHASAMTLVANLIQRAPLISDDVVSATFTDVLHSYPGLTAVGLLRVPMDGNPTLLAVQREGAGLRVSGRRPISAEALAALRLEDGPMVGGIMQTPLVSAPGILIRAPCRTNKTARICLLGVMDPAPFMQIPTSITSGGLYYISVLDHRGRQLTGTSDTHWNIKDLSAIPIVGQALQVESGVGEFTMPTDNTKMVASYVRVPEYGWVVLVAQAKHQIQRNILRVLAPQLIWVLIGILASVALAAWISRWITRPINALAGAAAKLPAALPLDRLVQEQPPFMPREIALLYQVLADTQARQRKYKDQILYIADHAPLLFAVCSLDGRITYAAGRLLALFNFPEKNVIGTSVAPLCPPDEPATSCLARVAGGGDHLWILSRNSWVIEMWAAAIRDREGRPEHLMFVGIDTSDTRIAQHTQKLLTQIRALHEQSRRVGEAERRQIAGELHDLLGQDLTAIRAYATLISNTATDSPGVDALHTKIPEYADEIDTTAAELQEVVQSMLVRLWPESLDRLGLPAALQELTGHFQKQHPDVRMTLHLPNDQLPLNTDQAITLYRVATEALTNIAKHADATTVLFSAARDDKDFEMVIGDNGKGFDTERSENLRHGLVGMLERVRSLGGKVEINSVPGQGTTITVRVLLNKTNTYDQ